MRLFGYLLRHWPVHSSKRFGSRPRQTRLIIEEKEREPISGGACAI